MMYSGPAEAWLLSQKPRVKQEPGRFSVFAQRVL
jgi:hypothetical protein